MSSGFTALTAPAQSRDALSRIRALLDGGEVLVLTGAGISTDSGIPDYRGPSGVQRRYAPMTFQSFVGDASARHRYWARSFLGWRQIADARPNAAHHAVARLQSDGRVNGLITQNVDGLHQAAGSIDVVELHGGLDRTRCLDCQHVGSRVDVEVQLRELNPEFVARAAVINPDGDAEVAAAELAGFIAPTCRSCGSSLLKPDVVFFGESVPAARVARCSAMVESARGLLVLGSSLTVFSGFRFVRAAARRQIPVAIVNQGPTRADELCTVRIDEPLGEVLPLLAA